MMQILIVRGCSSTATAVRVIVRGVKVKSSYVALDFGSEMKAATASSDEVKTYEPRAATSSPLAAC